VSSLQFFAYIAAWTMVCVAAGGVLGVWYAKKQLEQNVSAAFEVFTDEQE